LYKPDPRHLKRQKFCIKPECKAASKKYSQQKWLNKHKNRDYFSGPENVARVQEWRRENPGYWKRRKPLKKSSLIEDTLQEMKTGKAIAGKGFSIDLPQLPLQDLISAKTLVFIGFDTHLNKIALQEIIDTADQETVKLTPDILKQLTRKKRCQHGQTIFFNGTL
tara:strand:- start:337 stop:831 length:495 start_codon:yes stop_codon:yes gene_type:complete